jgi:hypothetical protein
MRGGLRRTDTVWKALGKAAALRKEYAQNPILLLTTDLPPRGSAGDAALRAAREWLIHDAIEMLSVAGIERLQKYASGAWSDRAEGDLLPPERP